MIEALAICAVLMILPFAIPIRIGGRGHVSDARVEVVGYLQLLLGVLGLDVIFHGGLSWRLKVGRWTVFNCAIDGKKEDDEIEPSADEEEEKLESKEDVGWRERLDQVLSYVEIVKEPALRLLKRVSKSIGYGCLEIEGDLGTGSPDSTGRIAGLLYSLQGSLGEKTQFVVRPDFIRPGFRGTFKVEIRFRLGYLILAILAAGLGIGLRFAMWYLRSKLAGLRRSKAQTA